MPDPKLAELTTDGNFRAKVAAILDDLASHGEDPKIFEAMRTREQQAEKVRLGYSKTMNSYHLKRGSDGKGKAADIADRKKGWNASKRFFMLLASSCWAHGVGSGILFGLNAKQRQNLKNAILTLRQAGWPKSHPAYETAIGWDGAHCQEDDNWS